MLIFKYIIYGIVISLINPPLFDSTKHIYIFSIIFNTTIFNDTLFPLFANIGIIFSFIIYLKNDIYKIVKNNFLYITSKKKEKIKYKKTLKYTFLFLISLIPITYFNIIFPLKTNLTNIIISLIISSIIIIIFNIRKGTKNLKDITFLNIIFITIFLIISNILNISDLASILLVCSLCNIKKDISLKISLIYYSLMNIFTIIFTPINTIDENLILPYIIGTIITSIFTLYSIKHIDSLIKKNKLWKISLYFFFLSLFLLYWFR